MEQKIITSSSASGLNQKIAELQKDGWEPIGSHSVVVVNEQKRFSGAQHSSTSFEHEYSMTVKRDTPTNKHENSIGLSGGDKSSVVLEHMLGYLTEKQSQDAKSQGLEGDETHLLGYLDTPQWIDAYNLFQLDEREALLKLAEKVDDTYSTNFRKEMINS